MASAGRILIMPKGNWDANTEYEMLDLVFAKNTSWLAKKNSVGIEPSVENAEYWFLLCESKNLDEVNQRLAAIENQLLSAITLDDIPEVDLSGYATKAELSGYATKTDLGSYATKTDLGTVNTNINGLDGRLDVVEPKVTNLATQVSSLATTLSGVSGAKFYSGRLSNQGAETVTIPCNFPPKFVVVIGTPFSGGTYHSMTFIIPDRSMGLTWVESGNQVREFGAINVARNGNNLTLTYGGNQNLARAYVCSHASITYDYFCIG